MRRNLTKKVKIIAIERKRVTKRNIKNQILKEMDKNRTKSMIKT